MRAACRAARHRTTCTSYDIYFSALPTAQANALNQASSTSYQTPASATAGFGFGLWATSATDPNAATTSFTYDAVGRPTSSTMPLETTGLTTQAMAYTVFCSGTAAQSPAPRWTRRSG